MNSFKSFIILLLILSSSFINAFDGIPDEDTYCVTWASSQYLTEANNLPPITLSNNSIRQIVHVSVNSPTIRIKFSNRVGDSDLEIKGVTLADSVAQGSGEIDTLTLTKLTFSGKEGVKIPPNSEIYSDPFYYPLKVQSEVAISIYFGEVPSQLTSHAGSRTFSFLEEGNKINEKKFSDKNKTAHWYVITAIEVSSSPAKKAVICYGDSITDGRGSTDDKQNRWTDVLSQKLYLNDKTMNVAVVNEGIGATFVRNHGLERFERDVINVKGATYIIVLYGVNDIIFSNATAEQVIEAYKTLIKIAHNNNKFIFAGTILPFGKNKDYWSAEKELVRREVNDWIRKSKDNEEGFDSYFDFDLFTKDPDHVTQLLDIYDCGDGLHPSPAGYARMVDAIYNLNLFTAEPNFDGDEEDPSSNFELVDKIGVKYKLDFDLKKDEEVNIRVKGKTNGSKGFRILTNNNENEKTSDYYYTGKIQKGTFDFNVKLKVAKDSNYIVIRRPISTINIDNIVLNAIEVKSNSNEQTIELKNGELLE